MPFKLKVDIPDTITNLKYFGPIQTEGDLKWRLVAKITKPYQVEAYVECIPIEKTTIFTRNASLTYQLPASSVGTDFEQFGSFKLTSAIKTLAPLKLIRNRDSFLIEVTVKLHNVQPETEKAVQTSGAKQADQQASTSSKPKTFWTFEDLANEIVELRKEHKEQLNKIDEKYETKCAKLEDTIRELKERLEVLEDDDESLEDEESAFDGEDDIRHFEEVEMSTDDDDDVKSQEDETSSDEDEKFGEWYQNIDGSTESVHEQIQGSVPKVEENLEKFKRKGIMPFKLNVEVPNTVTNLTHFGATQFKDGWKWRLAAKLLTTDVIEAYVECMPIEKTAISTTYAYLHYSTLNVIEMEKFGGFKFESKTKKLATKELTCQNCSYMVTVEVRLMEAVGKDVPSNRPYFNEIQGNAPIVDEKDEEIRALKSKLKAANRKVEAVQTKCELLQLLVWNTEAQRNDLTAKNQKLMKNEAQFIYMKAKLDEQEEIVSQLQSTLADRTNQLEKAEKDRDGYKASNETQIGIVEKLRKREKANMLELFEKVDIARKLDKDLEKKNQTLIESEAEIERLKTRVDAQQELVSQFKNRLADKMNQLEKVEKERDGYKEMNETHMDIVEKLREREKVNTRELERKEQVIVELSSKVEELEKELKQDESTSKQSGSN